MIGDMWLGMAETTPPKEYANSPHTAIFCVKLKGVIEKSRFDPKT